jgi:hypothetical protein
VHLDSDPEPAALDVDIRELRDAQDLGEGSLLIEVEADARLELTFLVFRTDLYGLEDDSGIQVTDCDWNEHFAEAATDIDARLTIEIEVGEDGIVSRAKVLEAERTGVGPR